MSGPYGKNGARRRAGFDRDDPFGVGELSFVERWLAGYRLWRLAGYGRVSSAVAGWRRAWR